MNVLWLSWKDIHHPLAGGAERLGHGWRRGLLSAGHRVRHITARYPGAAATDTIDGVETIRCGRTRLTHYPSALACHLRRSRWADCIVEEVNTVPYFAAAARTPVVLVYFQLAREIWFHQTPLPVAIAGYGAEAVYTRLQSLRHTRVITISADTRRDLARFGFSPDRVDVVGVGIDNAPIAAYDPRLKEDRFTVLFHGSLRSMKRPLDAIRAFDAFAAQGGEAALWVSGGGDATALRREIAARGLDSRATVFGQVPDDRKLDLMRRATVLISTSVKEGWGLIVTEANSMGTPAIVYDVDGLRSAAGPHNWITAPDPASLASRLVEARQVFYTPGAYRPWCEQVLADSRRYTHAASYREFEAALLRAVAS